MNKNKWGLFGADGQTSAGSKLMRQTRTMDDVYEADGIDGSMKFLIGVIIVACIIVTIGSILWG